MDMIARYGGDVNCWGKVAQVAQVSQVAKVVKGSEGSKGSKGPRMCQVTLAVLVLAITPFR